MSNRSSITIADSAEQARRRRKVNHATTPAIKAAPTMPPTMPPEMAPLLEDEGGEEDNEEDTASGVKVD